MDWLTRPECSLWFYSWLVLNSAHLSSPSQWLCPALSSVIKLSAFTRRWLLPSPSLAGSQTLVSSTTSGLRLFGGQLLYPIEWAKSKDMAIRELIRGLGYFGHPSPPGGSLSPTNLLYRENFSQSAYMELAWH